VLALSAAVLVVVVITLSALLIGSAPQAASPPSGGGVGISGAVNGAGSSEVVAAPEISLKHHAQMVAAHN
jgi:ABC-type phosphate transport system substrate-binding protein